MNDNNHIDKFINKSFESNLMQRTSENFTAKLMREIELAKRFEVEDKKTSRFAGWMIAASTVFVFIAGTIILLILGGNSAEGKSSQPLDTINEAFSFLSRQIFLFLGLKVSTDLLLYVFGSLAAILIFTLIDKMVLKRKIN